MASDEENELSSLAADDNGDARNLIASAADEEDEGEVDSENDDDVPDEYEMHDFIVGDEAEWEDEEGEEEEREINQSNRRKRRRNDSEEEGGGDYKKSEKVKRKRRDEEEMEVDYPTNRRGVAMSLTDTFVQQFPHAADERTIKLTDIPERLQMGSAYATRDGLTNVELQEEAEWMFNTVFKKRKQSKPNVNKDDWETAEDTVNNETVDKDEYVKSLKTILGYIIKNHLEAPFLATYRKEYLGPFTIDDLFLVQEYDDKWTTLTKRKNALKDLHDKVENLHRMYAVMLDGVQTIEDVSDLLEHFKLHHNDIVDGSEHRTQRRPTKRDYYTSCKSAGLAQYSNEMGLTAFQYAENLYSFTQQNIVNPTQEPQMLAEQIATSLACGPEFKTAELVLKGMRHVLAYEIAREPIVRQRIRVAYEENAQITTKPTPQKGAYTKLKPLDGQPIGFFCDTLDFLNITKEESEGFITVQIKVPDEALEQALDYRNLFLSDKLNQIATKWNEQRELVIKEAIQLLHPIMEQHVRKLLTTQAQELVCIEAEKACEKMLMAGPYGLTREYFNSTTRQSLGSSKTLKRYRVMSCSLDDMDDTIYLAVVDSEGELIDKLILASTNNAHTPEGQKQAQNQRELLSDFIYKHDPNVTCVGAASLQSRTLFDLVKDCVLSVQRYNEDVYYIAEDAAKVYSLSSAGAKEFPDLLPGLRKCVSLARRLQDPLSALAALCNEKNDILCLKFHPKQNLVSKEVLFKHIERVFIKVTCKVGVDINRMIMHKHYAHILKFVSGLGPRKADYIQQKMLELPGIMITGRKSLVEANIMKKYIFINCAGFIKVPNIKNDEHHDILDDTRIHPECYELALKMSLDAFEAEGDDSLNPDEYVLKAMARPDLLDELDLDAYANELQQREIGKRHITLKDIKDEIQHPFKDPRNAFAPPTPDELFTLLTGETDESLKPGTLVNAVITKGERNRVTVRLDNSGLTGYVERTDDPDQHQQRPGTNIQCVVLDEPGRNPINKYDFSVLLSAHSSDISKAEALEDFYSVKVQKKKSSRKPKLMMRKVNHIYFKNINYPDAIKELKDKEPGTIIIRPSSRGHDHLAVTFKFFGNTTINIDVLEKDKKEKFSLGSTLFVGSQKFEDLDDICINYVEKIIGYANDMISQEKYTTLSREEIEIELKKEKDKAPKRIPYRVALNPDFPGRFTIYYMPHAKARHEHFVVTNEGFKFNKKLFKNPTKLFNEFKESFYKRKPGEYRSNPAQQQNPNNTSKSSRDNRNMSRGNGRSPTHHSSSSGFGSSASRHSHNTSGRDPRSSRDNNNNSRSYSRPPPSNTTTVNHASTAAANTDDWGY